MSLRIREKDGKITSISAFQVLRDPGKARATINEIRKRHNRTSSSSSSPNSKDDKKDEVSPGAAPKIEDKAFTAAEVKAREASEYLQKKRAALLSELGSLNFGAPKMTAELNKGKARPRFVPPLPPIIPENVSRDKSAGSTPRKAFTGIREGSKFVIGPNFDPTDVPDADATLPEAKVTEANFEDLGVPESERPKLSLAHLALVMRLNEYYDKIKYETIASRFFDCTSVRVKPEELKHMIEEGLTSGKSA